MACDNLANPEPVQYTISFNSHGGSAVEAVTAIKGTLVPKPIDPARAGFAFAGWFNAETGGTEYAWPHTLTAGITMHAQWTAVQTYTLAFDTHGGSAVAVITQNEGTQVARPADPAKDGFVITGWFDAETGGTEYAWPHTLNADVTMHAQWTAAYTVTFDSHDGTAVAAITQAADTQVSRPADPTKDGLVITGWFDAETGGTEYTWPHTLNADVTMHAQWAPVYTVTFDSHDGTAVAAITQAANTQISRPADPTKDGFILSGWYNAETDGTAYVWPHTLSANVTMHAQWTAAPPIQYTVTFHTDGGNAAPEPQTVVKGETATEPALVAAIPYDADAGLYRHVITWHTDAAYTAPWDFNTPVTGDLDLYSNGTISPVDLSGQSGDHILAKALRSLAEQSSTANYTILLDAGNYSLPGIPDGGQANISMANAVITLLGKAPVEINLSSNGSLLRVDAGELVLDNHIALKGLSSNTVPLVYVDGTYASLTMKAGAKISGNSVSSFFYGGGVHISGGNFTMSGGEISGNSISALPSSVYGGGVYVSGGNFTMSGGKISGNSVRYTGYGGGVYIADGNFTMSGGEISGNSGTSYGGGVSVGSNGSFTLSSGEISGNSGAYGGGVYTVHGSFTLSNGEIFDNTVTYQGGGVYVLYGSFTQSGGKIFNNTATLVGGGGVYICGSDSLLSGGEISDNHAVDGGGVYIEGGLVDSFTQSGGKISGNSASSCGGGLYVWNNGRFILSGGEISGNSAADQGGGLYIGRSNGVCSKTGGGVIYGSDAAEFSLKNTAGSGNTNGHAVFYMDYESSSTTYYYYRDTTLDENDDISTLKLPASGADHNWTKK
jgi:uncharacterized repeat protein (TIGR02543 family)